MHSSNAKRNECLHWVAWHCDETRAKRNVRYFCQNPQHAWRNVLETSSFMRVIIVFFATCAHVARQQVSPTLKTFDSFFLRAWSSFMLFLVLGSALQRKGAVVPFDDLARNNAERCALSRLCVCMTPRSTQQILNLVLDVTTPTRATFVCHQQVVSNSDDNLLQLGLDSRKEFDNVLKRLDLCLFEVTAFSVNKGD